MSAPSRDHHAIIEVIRSWPRDEQIELAHEILNQSEATEATDRGDEPGAVSQSTGKDSWAALVGFLATDQPAPTDDEIERWREEWRVEKYGR